MDTIGAGLAPAQFQGERKNRPCNLVIINTDLLRYICNCRCQDNRSITLTVIPDSDISDNDYIISHKNSPEFTPG